MKAKICGLMSLLFLGLTITTFPLILSSFWVPVSFMWLSFISFGMMMAFTTVRVNPVVIPNGYYNDMGLVTQWAGLGVIIGRLDNIESTLEKNHLS